MSDQTFLLNYIQTRSGPLTLEFLGHSSPDEFDREAGEPGSCLQDALRWHIHRATINEFDALFSPWVEGFTGIPRAVDSKRTEAKRSQSPNPNKITPIKERFLAYMNRVMVKVDSDTQQAIKLEALRVSRTVRINVAPATSVSPIEPMFLKQATSILSQPLDEINRRVSNYLALVPSYELARDDMDKPILESLARLMREKTEKLLAMED